MVIKRYGTSGKRVGVKSVSQVRILFSPQKGKDPLNNNQRVFFVIVGSMFGDYSSNSVINFLYVERICPILLNDSSNCIARHSSSQ